MDKNCPRCGSVIPAEDEHFQALSRRDNKTYICNNCGQEEAFVDAGMAPAAVIERDEAFVKKLANK